jgi:uncharacterized membrane protein
MQGFTGGMLGFGWETFKKRGWYFAGVALFIAVVSGIASQLSAFLQQAPTGGALVIALALVFVSVVAQILIKMGSINFSLKAHDTPESVSLRDLWAPETFWNYLLASILVGLILIAGFILLVVPGVIWMLRYLFVPYLIIDRKLGVMESLRESARITKGKKGRLLILLIAIVLLNIVGVICVAVGLLVTIPVTMFAVAHAYRTLEHTASEVAAPVSA